MYHKLQPPHQYTEMYLQCMKLCVCVFVCEMKACSSIPCGALVPEGAVRGLDCSSVVVFMLVLCLFCFPSLCVFPVFLIYS